MSSISYEGINPDPGWDAKIVFGIYLPSETRYYVEVTFDFLSFGAAVGFFIWSLLIRQPMTDSTRPLPLKTLVGSILLFACVRFFRILIHIFSIAGATVRQSYVVIYILNNVFINIAFALSLFVFWHLIHKLLEQFSTKKLGKKGVVAMAHWAFLGIFSAMEIAQCALYIASVASEFTGNHRTTTWRFDNYYLATVVAILYWVASLEILCWFIFIFAKSGTEKKNIILTIGVAAFFFFGDNLRSAIIHILFNIYSAIKRTYNPPLHVDSTISIVDFICFVGTYVPLLLGLQKWSHNIFNDTRGALNNYSRRTVSSESMISSAPSVRSQRATFHSTSNGKRRVRVAVPEGAPPGQQVHMWS